MITGLGDRTLIWANNLEAGTIFWWKESEAGVKYW